MARNTQPARPGLAVLVLAILLSPFLYDGLTLLMRVP